MTMLLKFNGQVARFLFIGTLAALTHVSIVAYLDLHPLLSNIIAFLIAFIISFLGHKYLTFSSLHNQKKLKLPYFFLVAISALVFNESLYFLLLRFTTLHYLLSLLLVLSSVSVYTFVLSRFWACR